MNPTHLRLRNVRRFANLDIDLPAGTVALVGGNGAGKSSLLNAIDIALFADRGELNQLITTGEDALEIELTFEHAGELYRVRRQLKRGKSPSVDFERLQREAQVYDGDDGTKLIRLVDGAWEPLTRENAATTNAAICETLGLTRDTFRASSFLKQGDTAAFTEADPASRKALLAKIMRLDRWDDSDGRKPATEASLLGLARADLRDAEQKLPRIETRVEQLEQHLPTRDGHVAALDSYKAKLRTATDELIVAEERLERAQTAKHANEAAAERLRTCQAELDAATAALSRAEAELAASAAAADKVETLTIEIEELAADIATIQTLEQQLEQHRARAIKTAERDQLFREAEQREQARGRLGVDALELRRQEHSLRAKAVQLLDDVERAGECDRCGQTLGVEAAQRAADSYRAEAAELAGRAEKLGVEIAAIAEEVVALTDRANAVEIPDVDGDPEAAQAALTRARAAVESHAKLTEQLRQATELAGQKETLQTVCSLADANVLAARAALDDARGQVGDTAQLDTAVRDAQAQVSAARANQQEANTAIARTEQILEQLDAAKAERDALVGEHAMIKTLVEKLRARVAAYGRNGIPALIVEAVAVPQIEQEANRLLELMPTADGTTLQVQLRTQRELKGSEELRDALDIVIFDGDAERLYETYSGGEQSRVNLCLGAALALLLTHRRGAESKLLAIDELPALDALGQDQLVDVVKALAPHFERTIVVGHSETFQQSFDQTIRIVKRGGRSVVDAEREAVAA